MTTNGSGQRRKWYHPRKSDLAFAAGTVVFLVNGLTRKEVSPEIVYGSIALMGFSAAGRVDQWFDNNGGKK